MHREHQRRCQGRQVEVGAAVVAPLIVSAFPPQREDLVHLGAPARDHVAGGGNVRHQPHAQEGG